MAHQLRLRVVAEGVDGCDEIQGYLLGRRSRRNIFPALGGLVTERA